MKEKEVFDLKMRVNSARTSGRTWQKYQGNSIDYLVKSQMDQVMAFIKENYPEVFPYLEGTEITSANVNLSFKVKGVELPLSEFQDVIQAVELLKRASQPVEPVM